MAVSPDQRLMLTGGDDESVRLWELADAVQLQRMSEHRGPVNAVAFSPDGGFAVSGASDNSIIYWNIAASTSQRTEFRRFGSHDDNVTHLIISPDGQFVLSTSMDRTIVYGMCVPGPKPAVISTGIQAM